MTDQMFVFLCNDVHRYAFEYRRGDLQDVEKHKFEKHVAACAACRDYVDRLEGMLDAAATHDFGSELDRDQMFDRILAVATNDEDQEPVQSGDLTQTAADEPQLDRNELFSRITAELDSVPSKQDVAAIDEKPAANVVQLQTRSAQEQDDEPANAPPPSAGRVGFYIAVALAAGIAIGLVAPQFMGEPPTSSTEQLSENNDETTETPQQRRKDNESGVFDRVELADLYVQPTPSDVRDVRVFGEPTANWELRTQGIRRQIQLQSGTVLVEFVPEGERELEFVSDDFTVRVTGTVFYASAEQGIVGVVTGSVEVSTKDGETVQVVDGQEWVAGSGLRQAPEETRATAERHVPVTEHQAKLAALERPRPLPAERATPEPAPRPPMSPEVKETPRQELRRAADNAMGDGRYAVAAQYYERMVEELSAADPANATLRLDLSRIYIRHLGEQGRARVHLRRFVEDRPADPATPSAKSELCRIARESGAPEALCE